MPKQIKKVRQNIVVNKSELEGIFNLKIIQFKQTTEPFLSATQMKKIHETYISLIIQSKQNRFINQYFLKKSTQKLRKKLGGRKMITQFK